MAVTAENNNILLQHEQVQNLVRLMPYIFVAELFAAIFYAWIYSPSNEVSHLVVRSWLLAYIALTLARYVILKRLTPAIIDPHAPAKRWFNMLRVLMLSGAALFSVGIVLFNPIVGVADFPTLTQMIQGVILISLTVIGIAGYSSCAYSSSFYIILLLTPPSVLGIVSAAVSERPAVGVLMPTLMLAFLVGNLFIHRVIALSIRNKLQRQLLIQYLESTKKEAEELSEKLAKEVYDRSQIRQRLQESNNRLEFVVNERTRQLQDTNNELKTASQRLSMALEASGTLIWEWDNLRNTAFSASLLKRLGYQDVSNVAKTVREIVHPDDFDLARQKGIRHLKGLTSNYHAIYRLRHKNGQWHWFEDNGQVVERDSFNRAVRMIGTRRDVTSSYQAEEQRRLAATVFENSSDGIFIMDTDFRFLVINSSFTYISGYEAEDVIGGTVERDPDYKKYDDYKLIFEQLRQEGFWQGEIRRTRKDGNEYPASIQINAVYDDHNRLTHYVGRLTDLTDTKKNEQQLVFLSNHDRLTGLANRKQFQETLHRNLSIARIRKQKVALLYLDLDRFKPINDTLGHDVGDNILRQTAKRIKESGLSEEQLARIESDEFTIILDYEKAEEINKVAKAIINAIKRPFYVNNQELLLGTSIGIALFPDTANDVRTLISQADIAMHQSKRMGGNTFQYYKSDMRSATVEQLALETSLRKAMSNNEFVVYYQPKMDLEDGVIRGTEALIRWKHPTMGLLTPSAFIPLAEETGLITEIGEWVLNQACLQTAAWRKQGIGNIVTSVNLSAHQFISSDVTNVITKALKHSELPPELLELELTESLLMDDLDRNINTLKKLREIGVSLSLDDFGTGYSSLSYLKRFPIDTLKIDRAFIMELETNEDDAAIAQAIISMAHSLQLKVIAEGVETEGQKERLRHMTCDSIQGYLISRPVPAAEMGILLFQQRHRYNQA